MDNNLKNQSSVQQNNQNNYSPLQNDPQYDNQEIKRYEIKLHAQNQEIERLNTCLRDKCQESESWMQKCVHLESHIKPLRQYEERCDILAKDNSQINNLLVEKMKDIDALKLEMHERQAKYENNEKSDKILLSEIQYLKNELIKLDEILLKKDDEIVVLARKANAYEQVCEENKTLQEELRRLDEMLTQRDNEVVDLKELAAKVEPSEKEIELLNSNLQSVLNQNEIWKKTCSNLQGDMKHIRKLEANLVVLSTEIDRLHRIVREKIEINENIKSKNSILESTVYELRIKEQKLAQYENEIQRLAVILDTRDNDLAQKEELIKQKENLMIDYDSRLEKNDQKIHALEKQVGKSTKESNTTEQLSSENDKMKMKLKQQDTYIKELRLKEKELQTSQQQLQTKENLIQEMQQQFDDQVETTKEDMQRLKESDHKLKFMGDEIERLNGLQNSTEQEISQWRQKYWEYNSLSTKYDNIMVQFVMLCSEIDSLRSQIQQQSQEVNHLRTSQIRLSQAN